MIKRLRWVFLAIFAGGAFLWLGYSRSAEKIESDTTRPSENKRRESSRRRTGELERNLPTPLEKKVAAQEQLVEEQKVTLSALLKARNSNSLKPGGLPPDATPEDAAERAEAAQTFEDARQAYNANRQLLEKLKLELAEEQKNANPALDSH